MNLVVRPSAAGQLVALPEVDVIELLRFFPLIGRRLRGAPGRRGYYAKLVIIRRRRWTMRIIYRIEAGELAVHFIEPSWVRRTSSELPA